MKTVMRSAMLGAMLLGAASAARAQDVVLQYSNWLPVGHVINDGGVFPFFEAVERVTDGRVRVETLPTTVGTPVSQYDVAAEGLADITFVITGYTPGRFPLTEVVELPFIGSDPEAVSVALWRVYQQDLAQYGEFRDTVPLSLFVASSSNIATRNTAVTSLADLQGLKMRNPLASFVTAAEALGVVPVNKTVAEVYELASTGVIDGAFVPLDSLRSFRLNDVLHNYTLVDGGILSPAMGLFINHDSWARISAEDQAAIMAVAGEELSRAVGAGYRQSDLEVLAQLGATGTWHVNQADEAFMAELRERLSFMRDDWTERASAAGVANPQEIIARLVAEVEAETTKGAAIVAE